MELADKINEINDVDDFIHDFVDITNSLGNASSITHPASRRRKLIFFKNSFIKIISKLHRKNSQNRSEDFPIDRLSAFECFASSTSVGVSVSLDSCSVRFSPANRHRGVPEQVLAQGSDDSS